MNRRQFNDREAAKVIEFYYRGVEPGREPGGSMSRTYTCDCGFRTASSGAIYDHCVGEHAKS